MSQIGRLLKSIRSSLKGPASEAVKMATGIPGGTTVRNFARENPLTTAGLGLAGGAFVTEEIGLPLLSGAAGQIKQDFLDPFSVAGRERESYQAFVDAQNFRVGETLKDQRIKEMVQRNMEIVAMRDPHLFNQVMSGRILPQGAVVLGGPRRQDLMEELAYAMGTSSSPEEFSSLVS